MDWFENMIMLSGVNATANSVGGNVNSIFKIYFGTLLKSDLKFYVICRKNPFGLDVDICSVHGRQNDFESHILVLRKC